MSTCFFIGHREALDSLLPQLFAEIERHITEYGVTEFVVGRYGRFDALAAKCIKAAKKRHPEVTLTLLLPIIRMTALLQHSLVLMEHSTRQGWRLFRNVPLLPWLTGIWVAHNEYLIAYVQHLVSNAWDLVEYARRYEKQGTITATALLKP